MTTNSTHKDALDAYENWKKKRLGGVAKDDESFSVPGHPASKRRSQMWRAIPFCVSKADIGADIDLRRFGPITDSVRKSASTERVLEVA
jgi:hypothetical protein